MFSVLNQKIYLLHKNAISKLRLCSLYINGYIIAFINVKEYHTLFQNLYCNNLLRSLKVFKILGLNINS